MLYQRRIAENQVVSAKLELQLRGSRYAGVGTHVMGMAAVAMATWFVVDTLPLLTAALGFLILNLWWSRRINKTLETNRHFTQRPTVMNELLAFAALTGLFWTFGVAWLDAYLPDMTFYLVVMTIALLSVVNIAVSVAVRPVYLTYIVTSLVAMALWLAWNADQRPYNPVATVTLSILAGFLIIASDWMSRSFSEMVETSLERAAMSKDLASLTESLKTRNLQLQDARQQLAQQATIDELTGLRNRRGVNMVINDEMARLKRSQSPMTVMAIDVDHFKFYNDPYGHPAGDVVLQRLANVMLELTERAGEFAARMGGEEFVLFFPNVANEDAANLAEELRSRIEALQIVHETSQTAAHVTISIGVLCCVPDWDDEFDQLLKSADEALYTSKTTGRNRFTFVEAAIESED